MATPTPFIWSFGRGLRKGVEKDWMHDWAGPDDNSTCGSFVESFCDDDSAEQIKVKEGVDDNLSGGRGVRKGVEKDWMHDWAGPDDSSSIGSFDESFCDDDWAEQIKVKEGVDANFWEKESTGLSDSDDDSDASSQCSEFSYESGWELEEELSVTGLSEIVTTIDLHQELSRQCEAVVMHKDSLPEKELSISQVPREIELAQDLASECETVLPRRCSVAAMIEQVPSKCKAVSTQEADLPEEKPSSRSSLPPRGRVAAMVQEWSSKSEAVSTQKSNLAEEDSSSVCEAVLPHKDTSSNETQPVEHVNTELADALRELQAARETNESLKRDYQELLTEHKILQEKHAMPGVKNHILKKVHCCYHSLRVLAMEACDSLNSKHQTLMHKHIDLSKEQEALKHRTNQESLLGLQTTEENLLEILAQQIC